MAMDEQDQILPDHIRDRLTDRLPDLQKSISLEKGVFLDMLCEEEVIESKELNEIRCGNSDEEKVAILVELIKKGSFRDYELFKKCLVNTGQGHVVSSILEKEASFSSWTTKVKFVAPVAIAVIAVIVMFGQYLWDPDNQDIDQRRPIAKMFKERYSRIPQYVSHYAWAVKQTEIYVPMTWVSVDRSTTKVRETQLNDYHQLLLKKEDNPLYLLISGESGCGKTTFSRMLAYSWAKYVLTPESIDNETKSVMAHFDYVLPLRLRDLHPNDSLVSFLEKQFSFLGNNETSKITRAIEHNPQRTLCIFDGYNEMPDDAPQIISDFIERKNLSFHLNLIITTREEKATDIRQFLGEEGTEALLKGFKSQQIKAFINKCYSGTNKSRHAFLKNLSTNNILLELSRNPLQLQMLCAASSSERKHLEHRSTLYLEFLMIILRRYEKEKLNKKKHLSNEEMLNTYKESLKKLGQFGFNGCSGRRLELTHTVQCAESMAGKEAMDLGILVHVMPDQTIDSPKVEFFHETFQYFIIALGIHLGNPSDEIIQYLPPSPLNFLAGLNPRLVNHFLSRVHLHDDPNGRRAVDYFDQTPIPWLLQTDMYGTILKGYKSLEEAEIPFRILYLSPIVISTGPDKDTLYKYLEQGKNITYNFTEVLYIDLAIRSCPAYHQLDILEGWNQRLTKILSFAFQSASLKHIYIWPADKAYGMLKDLQPVLTHKFAISYSCDKNATRLEPLNITASDLLYQGRLSAPAPLSGLVRLHVEGMDTIDEFMHFAKLFPHKEEVQLDLGLCSDTYNSLTKAQEPQTMNHWKQLNLTLILSEQSKEIIISLLKLFPSLTDLHLRLLISGSITSSKESTEQFVYDIRNAFPELKVTQPILDSLQNHRRYQLQQKMYNKESADDFRKGLEKYMIL